MKKGLVYLIPSLVLAAAAAGAIMYIDNGHTHAPVSKPEIAFEPAPVLECTMFKTDAGDLVRCTDKERDVTCYGGISSLSCLPNQWLNYPQSIANINEPILNEK